MAHITVPEAEALLDQEIKVLDHGFIRMVDYIWAMRALCRPHASPSAKAR